MIKLGSSIGTALVGSPTEDSGALKKHVRRSTFLGEKVGGCQRAYKRASALISLQLFSPKKLEGVSALICALARLYKRASALISALAHSNFFPKQN